ncbi:MAG: hypothetical protein ACPG4T_02015, partial [Nannocystaceae bacterium]
MPPETAHHPAIAATLASLRLASSPTRGDGGRRSFSVARTQALLALRDLPQPDPWQWTLELVRAANAISDTPNVYVHYQESSEESHTELLFRVPPRADT